MTILFAPTGIAGLILRHEPVWKIDFRLLGKMVLPYLGALITLLIAAGGIIALIEMINFTADEYSLGNDHQHLRNCGGNHELHSLAGFRFHRLNRHRPLQAYLSDCHSKLGKYHG